MAKREKKSYVTASKGNIPIRFKPSYWKMPEFLAMSGPERYELAQYAGGVISIPADRAKIIGDAVKACTEHYKPVAMLPVEEGAK